MVRQFLYLTLILALAGTGLFAQTPTMDSLKEVEGQGKAAAGAAEPGGARWGSGEGFDRAADGNYISTPLVPVPAGYHGSTRPALGNLVVGREGTRIKEPKTPLTPEGKAKEQGSGNKVWWTLGGLAAGAGLGFLIGGPIGAAVGAVIGGILGFIFG